MFRLAPSLEVMSEARHSKIHEELDETSSRGTLEDFEGICVDPGDVLVETAVETLMLHLQVLGLKSS